MLAIAKHSYSFRFVKKGVVSSLSAEFARAGYFGANLLYMNMLEANLLSHLRRNV
jgi:hypothetical protein